MVEVDCYPRKENTQYSTLSSITYSFIYRPDKRAELRSLPRFQSSHARGGMTVRKAWKRGLVLVPAVLVLFLALVAIPSANAVVQGHTAFVVQGHSPIVLLVTDPNGYQIGCDAVPCTSTSSPNFINTIPTGTPYNEGPATYDFTTNTITISNPVAGPWTVEYIGTSSGTFTITVTSCPETGGATGGSGGGQTESGCGNAGNPLTLTLVSGTVTLGQTGSASLTYNADGTITLPSEGVPEFPLGLGVTVVVLFVGISLLRSSRHLRLK
jgi:hypothetical protein